MRKKKKLKEQADLIKKIHKRIGRLKCPPTKILKDKRKYTRKVKHKEIQKHGSPFSLIKRWRSGLCVLRELCVKLWLWPEAALRTLCETFR